MQKKIIALAIAGLASTAAFAQTNVQIYGVVDAAVAYVNNSQGRDGMAVQTGVLAGNRIGFKGTEDLGNGLKAVFLLEQGFNLDDGSAASATQAFQRQAWVGLSSNAGTLSLGRQYAPGYAAFLKHDALGGALLSAGMTLNVAAANTIAGNSNARWNNSIKYASPVMGGFQAEVIYRAGEASNDMASNSGVGLGLGFAGGPIAVNYVFHHTDGSASGSDGGNLSAGQWVAVTPATGAVRDEHFIGATFDAKVMKILATAQFAENQGRGLNGRSSVELYTLGTIIPVGKGNIHANYGYLDLNGNDRKSGASGAGQSYAVAYTHGLSKRTTLYTAVNYTDLAGGSAAPSYANATGAAATTSLGAQNTANLINGGGNGTTVGFGVNHSF